MGYFWGDGIDRYKDRFAATVGLICLVLSYHWWRLWSEYKDLPAPGLLADLFLLQAAILAGTLIHELGHLIAGWIVDMKLRSFQAGPVIGVIRNGRWKFKVDLKQFSAGAVGMAPLHLENLRGREAFMILGGPIASLVTGMATGVAALCANGQIWEPMWAFLSMLSVVSLVAGVVNLIPQTPDALYSDGAQIYALIKNEPWAQLHLAFSKVASSLVTAARPRDYDIGLIERAGQFGPSGRTILLRLFACMHYIDAGRMSEAGTALEMAERAWDQAAVKRPASVCAEFVFFCAVDQRDAAAAERWWQRLENQQNIELDAEYWRARAAIMWLRNRPTEASHAWECGNALAQALPQVGAYEFTRSCFERLREALDTTAAPAAPAREPAARLTYLDNDRRQLAVA